MLTAIEAGRAERTETKKALLEAYDQELNTTVQTLVTLEGIQAQAGTLLSRVQAFVPYYHEKTLDRAYGVAYIEASRYLAAKPSDYAELLKYLVSRQAHLQNHIEALRTHRDRVQAQIETAEILG